MTKKCKQIICQETTGLVEVQTKRETTIWGIWGDGLELGENIPLPLIADRVWLIHYGPCGFTNQRYQLTICCEITT